MKVVDHETSKEENQKWGNIARIRAIDLDFNAATGEYIRSMGTTGEIQIIGCIINTYLETYDCDGIKLTEEGKVLQTSHGANYDGYSGIMSF